MSDDDCRGILLAVESILVLKRHLVFRVPEREEVVLLMSGGLDSVVAVDKMITEWDVIVHPLYIRRCAKAEVYEEAAFDHFAQFFADRYPRNLARPAKITLKTPPPRWKTQLSKGLGQPFGYPMRDFTLQSTAIQYASTLNARHRLNIRTVFAGITDADVFPHSSLVALRVATLAACLDTCDWSWQVTSPFLEDSEPMDKTAVVTWAHEKGIPLQMTRTCVGGSETADGTCLECRHRLAAFKKAGLDDPIDYQSRVSQGAGRSAYL